jgi:hypothetical protein
MLAALPIPRQSGSNKIGSSIANRFINIIFFFSSSSTPSYPSPLVVFDLVQKFRIKILSKALKLSKSMVFDL